MLIDSGDSRNMVFGHAKELIENARSKVSKSKGKVRVTYGATNVVGLPQEALDVLDSKSITNCGKLYHSDVSKAMNVLRESNFSVEETYLSFMYPGYKAPEFAEVRILENIGKI